MTDALVCALSMLVAYMALAGRVGGFQVIVLCFFGVFFYGWNELVTWRHAISDNGYTLRLFLFGSSFGVATAWILRFKDKIATTSTLGYFASRHTRTYGLIGACFVWLFLPILSCIGTIYDVNLSGNSITFLTPSILNLWFALSASCGMSYCVSILLGRKIHPHDIVFSSFSVIIFFIFREASLIQPHQLSTQILSQPFCADWLQDSSSLYWTTNWKNLWITQMLLTLKEPFSLSSSQLWLVEFTQPFLQLFTHTHLKYQAQWTHGFQQVLQINGYHLAEPSLLKVVFKWQQFAGPLVLDCYHLWQLDWFCTLRVIWAQSRFSMMVHLLRWQMRTMTNQELQDSKLQLITDSLSYMNLNYCILCFFLFTFQLI